MASFGTLMTYSTKTGVRKEVRKQIRRVFGTKLMNIGLGDGEPTDNVTLAKHNLDLYYDYTNHDAYVASGTDAETTTTTWTKVDQADPAD